MRDLLLHSSPCLVGSQANSRGKRSSLSSMMIFLIHLKEEEPAESRVPLEKAEAGVYFTVTRVALTATSLRSAQDNLCLYYLS